MCDLEGLINPVQSILMGHFYQASSMVKEYFAVGMEGFLIQVRSQQ